MVCNHMWLISVSTSLLKHINIHVDFLHGFYWFFIDFYWFIVGWKNANQILSNLIKLIWSLNHVSPRPDDGLLVCHRHGVTDYDNISRQVTDTSEESVVSGRCRCHCWSIVDHQLTNAVALVELDCVWSYIVSFQFLIWFLSQPLLGHNTLMDLMFLHDKFVRPLPGALFLYF